MLRRAIGDGLRRPHRIIIIIRNRDVRQVTVISSECAHGPSRRVGFRRRCKGMRIVRVEHFRVVP